MADKRIIFKPHSGPRVVESFLSNQNIATSGARDWEFFTIGADYYLAVANVYNGSTHNINSVIYKAEFNV